LSFGQPYFLGLYISAFQAKVDAIVVYSRIFQGLGLQNATCDNIYNNLFGDPLQCRRAFIRFRITTLRLL
jgi:hypothetical protein